MTSFLGRKWILRDSDSSADLLSRLLKLRGIEPERSADFLTPSLEKLHDPQELKDLAKAVERIRRAITNEEKILICGDYDVDGVTASAILFTALQELGAKVSVRLPHRVTDGYGLSERQIKEANELGVKLIVTVDNGISAREEIQLAGQLGIEVIVTDHHLPPQDLPPAYAIINPRQADCSYPCELLSGAAIAYKLASALLNYELRDKNYELMNELLGLATLGTIADVCPLTGENRIIVTHGLKQLSQTKNPGLLRIFENVGILKANYKLTSEDVGYRIGPRLNAAGRLDSALLAFQVLAHPTEAVQFADQLEELNRQRQALTQQTLHEAEDQLGQIGTEQLLIAGSPDWHPGIIGLTAGKLAEQYYRPVVIMCHRGDTWTGSCRSPEEFNITAALTELSPLLNHFGGHCCAAGFSLQEADRVEFERRLKALAEERLAGVELAPTLQLDLGVTEADLTTDFLRQLRMLEPYGEGNREPVLLWKNAPLADLRAVGAEGKHLSLRVGRGKLKSIGFGLGEALKKLQDNPVADLAFTFGEEEWQGRKSLQMKIVDLTIQA